ncbi:MAG: GNAT family N-acetyltransferase [bacterium]
MRFSFRPITLDNREEERVFSLLVSPDIFHSISWFRVLKDSGEGVLELKAVYNENNLEALLPLFYRKIGSIRWLDRAPATPYLYPIFIKRDEMRPSSSISHKRQVLNEIASSIEGKFKSARIFTSAQQVDIRAFIWRGWRSEVRYTILCEIDDVDRIWGRLSSKVRSIIKKGERDGLKFIRDGDIHLVRQFVNETFRAQGRRPPLSKSFFSAFQRHIIDAGFGFSPIVYDSAGKPQAGALIAIYDDRAYYISAGLSSNAHTSAGSYLLYNVMTSLSGRSKGIDLCGVNLRSIAHFKESFEGNIVPYYTVSWEKNPLFSTLIRFLKRRYFPI